MKKLIAAGLLLSQLSLGSAVAVGAGEGQPAPPCPGPKKRVAVLKFGSTGKFGAAEGFDVGEGLAAQLATALQQNGCVVVVDRIALASVLREQELAAAGVAAKETATRPGRLLGAQILIRGDITEFEPTKRGTGMTVGLGFVKLPMGVRLGGEAQTAHVALDVRLIDAATGQVLQARRVQATASGAGVGAGVDTVGVSVGGDHFFKTPLGEASRKALISAAGEIVRSLAAIPWTARVMDVVGDQIYVSAGEEAGLRVGERLQVVAIVRELVDPDTQQVVGTVEAALGEAEVIEVKGKYSIARALGSFTPKRGDVTRQAERPVAASG